jgi:hypothetical protein
MTERLEPITEPSADELSVGSLAGTRLVELDASAAPHWTFSFSNGAQLHVTATWRVIAGGRVVVAAGDHEQLFGHALPVDAAARARAALGSGPVASSRCSPQLGDLTLDFPTGARLEVLTDSSGYEAWSLARPDGVTVVATGGGGVVAFRPVRTAG